MKISKRVLLTVAITTLSILPWVATAQSDKPTMKAIVIHTFGEPEVLKYEDAPRPEPKEDEILIRVMAA